MDDKNQAPPTIDPLSPRQRRFVEEYLIDRNATAAYMRAGYRGTRETARRNASSLLATADISAAVKKGEEDLLERVRFRQHEIYTELRHVALSNVDSYLVDDDGNVRVKAGVDESAMRAISSIQKKTTTRTGEDGVVTTHDVKITLWNKVDSIRIAAQTQGMLIDKSEQTGAAGGPVVIKVEYDEEKKGE